GEPIGSIAVFRDLRALRRLQAELTQAEKLAGIGELVAGVAHEFNSPLTVMLGLSEMGAETVEEPESRTKFERIFEQAVRAREIVSKLLQFARKGEGKRVACDLHEQIGEAIEMASFSGSSKDITIETAFTGAEARIECNPEEVRQVFMNLIQNAIHAIQDDRKKGAITVRTELSDGWFTTSVGDDGPGVSDDLLKRVFDPFFTTKEVGKGTGLGLSICHGILKDHGGEIRVERNPERGVTFFVDLPAGKVQGA
ncbi:MAG: sensor histidine kinase, partial [Planctomycetota bacterium]